MYLIEKNTIQGVYKELIEEIKNREIVGNTKEINNCCLIVHNPTLEHLYFPYRQISQLYCNEELKWYWSGDNSCKTIGEYASMWLKITDDGVTNNSAYGYILFKKYGFNQLEQIIELLKQDKNTRRAVLNISDPAINRIKTKDMQCTIAIQFIIRNNELQETVYMRSNDVYFGLPYDYIFFVTLGLYIAKQLGIKLSLYTHHATSMHMYLKDEEKLKDDKIKLINVNYKYIIGEYYGRY